MLVAWLPNLINLVMIAFGGTFLCSFFQSQLLSELTEQVSARGVVQASSERQKEEAGQKKEPSKNISPGYFHFLQICRCETSRVLTRINSRSGARHGITGFHRRYQRR